MTETFKITNPERDFEFNGKVYKIRKATLGQAIQFQQKAVGLDKDKPEEMVKLLAFAIQVMLQKQEPDLTTEQVLEQLPADTDVAALLSFLGFINPSTATQIKDTSSSVAS